MDKKGQELTLGTIVLIVLGIAVLVFLIFGFTTGWGQLWSKIGAFGSDSNVEDVKLDCKTDCLAGEESSFCLEKKTLKVFNEKGNLVEMKATCNQLRSRGNDSEEGVDYSGVSLNGFDQCAEIECSS